MACTYRENPSLHHGVLGHDQANQPGYMGAMDLGGVSHG